MSKKGTETGTREDVAVQPRDRVKRPKRFRVILFNDDYTSMEFVVELLESVFRHAPPAAVAIMLQVHERGSGVAGVYPFDIAESKLVTVHDRARSAGYPLRADLQEE